MIIVTGGSGFLGSHVVEKLRARGHRVFAPTHSLYDLRDPKHVEAMFDAVRPDKVIHLAATCGGIGANQKQPGTFFYDNILMGVNLMEAARLNGVISSSKSERSARIRSTAPCRSRKRTSGTDTPRRRTRRME